MPMMATLGTRRRRGVSVALPAWPHPTLGVSPAAVARWAQMKADYDANPSAPATLGGRIYKFGKTEADKPTGSNLDQIGQWAAIFYQITGDQTYAQRAISILKTNVFWTQPTSAYDGNPVREYGQMLVLIYDWIYNGIGSTDRDAFRTKLGALMDRCVNGGVDEGFGTQTALNTRTGDTDQCTGEWTALGMWAVANRNTDGVAEALFQTVGGSAASAQVVADNPIRHPGSTGNPNPVNARNAMYYYVNRMAKGGEWLETSHYNMGTLQLLMFGYDCMRSYYPTPDMEDIGNFVKDVALRQIHFATNDRDQSFQYGDVDANDARIEMQQYHYYGISMNAATLCAGEAIGPYLQRFILDHINDNNFPDGPPAAAEPTPRSFLVFDPYQTAAADYTSVVKSLWMEGQGQLISRPSWDADDSAFWCQWLPGCKFVHHQIKWNGAFQLYRKNYWALTHPQAYGSGTTGSLATPGEPGSQNSLRFSRIFSTPPWYGGGGAISDDAINGFSRSASKIGTNYVYLVGTAGGPFHPAGQYASPPPTCMHENTREIVKLHSTTKDNDVIVIFDRANLVDPRTLASYARYTAAERALMDPMTIMKEWFLFSNVAPAVGGVTATHGQVFASDSGNITWTDPGGNPIKVETLLPTDVSKLVHDWSATGIHGTAYVGAELNFWRTTIYPTATAQWDTFLTVVSAYDNATTAPASTLITGTADRKGCRVTRPSEDDYVLMFNTLQGADLPANNTANWVAMKAQLDAVRFAATGFSFTYTQTTASAKVLLFDLDPAHSWTKNVDGAGATSLTVDSTGVGEITVSGATSHTIVLA